MPRVAPDALWSVFTSSRTVRGTTSSAASKRTVTLPSSPRWNICPPVERERLSVAETGSLNGHATPYLPLPVSCFAIVRNSSQVHGFRGVGMRTPD